MREKVIQKVKPCSAAGPAWQRLMAIELLLVCASPDESASAAEKLAADESSPEAVRGHAFQDAPRGGPARRAPSVGDSRPWVKRAVAARSPSAI